MDCYRLDDRLGVAAPPAVVDLGGSGHVVGEDYEAGVVAEFCDKFEVRFGGEGTAVDEGEGNLEDLVFTFEEGVPGAVNLLGGELPAVRHEVGDFGYELEVI